MKRTLRIGVLGMGACVVPAANAGAAKVVTDWTVLRWTGDGEMYSGNAKGSIVDGSFQMTHAWPHGARMVVHTTGLQPGHAYTLWYTFFNHPDRCHFPPSDDRRCGVVDLLNPMADASLVFGDGAVANLDGVATFEGYRPVGVEPVGDEQIAHGSGVLTNPLGAEYQATLRSHGPYDPDTYGDAQLTTLDGGCHPGEKYTCTDDQASGFRSQL